MERKIAIIGISGTGKSTFARELAAITGLPLYHADSYEWQPNWIETSRIAAMAAHNVIIQKDEWILEGWIDPSYAQRLEKAELVIDIDIPGYLAGWRTLKRMLGHPKRDELPEDCIDRISLGFLKTVLFKQERISINAALRHHQLQNYVKLATPKAVRHWLDDYRVKSLAHQLSSARP